MGAGVLILSGFTFLAVLEKLRGFYKKFSHFGAARGPKNLGWIEGLVVHGLRTTTGGSLSLWTSFLQNKPVFGSTCKSRIDVLTNQTALIDFAFVLVAVIEPLLLRFRLRSASIPDPKAITVG